MAFPETRTCPEDFRNCPYHLKDKRYITNICKIDGYRCTSKPADLFDDLAPVNLHFSKSEQDLKNLVQNSDDVSAPASPEELLLGDIVRQRSPKCIEPLPSGLQTMCRDLISEGRERQRIGQSSPKLSPEESEALKKRVLDYDRQSSESAIKAFASIE